jgi:hypothetical protein
MSASVVWLQGVRRLFAACRFCCVVVRNGAETGMWEPPDSRNEQPVKDFDRFIRGGCPSRKWHLSGTYQAQFRSPSELGQ